MNPFHPSSLPPPNGTGKEQTGISLKKLEQNEQQREYTTEQLEYLEKSKRKKVVSEMNIPAEDSGVRAWLRFVDHPVILFGERPSDRKDRLKTILSEEPFLYKQLSTLNKSDGEIAKEASDPRQESWVEGSEELVRARKWILEYSLESSKNRLSSLLSYQNSSSNDEKLTERKQTYSQIKGIQLWSSQIVGQKMLSACSFLQDKGDDDHKHRVIVGDFSGNLNISGENCVDDEYKFSFLPQNPHSTRINCIDNFGPSTIAISDTEGIISTWTKSDESIESTYSLGSTLEGHGSRVPSLSIHPSGKYLASASFDCSWRLWDIESSIELQKQFGHDNCELFGIGWHPDGALVCTGDLKGFGRLWDVRAGKCIWTLEGHLKGLMDLAFHPLKPLLHTCSEDGTVRVWDLRKTECSMRILAHNAPISSIKITESCLITSSFDECIKVWAASNWSELACIRGHDGKIFDVSILDHSHGFHFASVGSDKTLKLWKSPDSL